MEWALNAASGDDTVPTDDRVVYVTEKVLDEKGTLARGARVSLSAILVRARVAEWGEHSLLQD